jgi:hypothetical protein
VLVERVSRDGDVDPLAASSDDRQHRTSGLGHPNRVLELGHVLLDRTLLRERPGQHELGFKHGPTALDHAVEGGSYPPPDWLVHPTLDSPIHGLGVFLLQPVRQGGLIWRFDARIDRVYTEEEITTLPEHMQRFLRTYSTCGIKQQGSGRSAATMAGTSTTLINRAPSQTRSALARTGQPPTFLLARS